MKNLHKIVLAACVAACFLFAASCLATSGDIQRIADAQKSYEVRVDGALADNAAGLKTAEDLVRLGALGYHAFLMGERFMTMADPGAELGALLSAVRARSGSHAG